MIVINMKFAFCIILFAASSFGQSWHECGSYEYFYKEGTFVVGGYYSAKEICEKLNASLVLIKSGQEQKCITSLTMTPCE